MSDLDLELQQGLRRVLTLGKFSQSAAARGASLSPATVSQFLASTPENILYKGDMERVQKKLRVWVDLTAERFLAPAPPPFVPTAISEDIQQTLRLAHVERVIGVVVGPPGIGKTAAIDHYSKEVGDTVSLYANASWDARAVLVGICSALGVQAKGSTWQIAQRATEALTGTGRLLVVDEAQFLKYPALEILRCIQDRARMGLVLCGMQRLYNNMMGRDREIYAHLFSRVARCLVLTGEIEEVDIIKIVRSVFPDASAREIEMFIGITNDPSGGRLRNLIQVVCHLKRHLTVTNTKLSAEMVQEAGNLLMFKAKG